MGRVPYYDDPAALEEFADRAHAGLDAYERTFVERYFTDSGASVLDVGCGVGRATKALADRGFDPIGIDISPHMIEAAREVHSDLAFRVDDATDLAVPDEAFEYVLFSDCGIDDIRPAAERMRSIVEAWRVLTPGGIFAFNANNIFYRYLLNPLSPSDWVSRGRFLVRNVREGLVGTRYARVQYPHGIDTVYSIAPPSQRRQLEDVGFTVEAVLPESDRFPTVLLDERPYYIARKPK